MMTDPRSGEWLLPPSLPSPPERALEGRLCPVPAYPVPDKIEERVEEITARRRC